VEIFFSYYDLNYPLFQMKFLVYCGVNN